LIGGSRIMPAAFPPPPFLERRLRAD